MKKAIEKLSKETQVSMPFRPVYWEIHKDKIKIPYYFGGNMSGFQNVGVMEIGR